MKKIILSILALMVTFGLYAQSPQSFNYQAVVRDAQGLVLPGQAVSFQLSILSGSSTGPSLYTETHSLTTNDFGLANLQIGAGTVVSGSLVSIAWGNSSHFIQVELDENGGSNFQLMGTSQFISVPYALHAQTVEVDQVDDSDADSTNELNTGLQLSGATLEIMDAGGSLAVDLSSLQDSLWQANGADISNTNTGNVGIGTNSPAARLDLSPGSSTSGSTILRAVSPAAANYESNDVAYIQAGPAAGYDATVLTVEARSNPDSAFNLLDVRNSAVSTAQSQLLVTGDGRVGIDTEDPMAHFSIGGKYNLASNSLADSMDIDLMVGGSANSAYNQDAVKLYISRYDNDGSEVYPILVEDENTNLDFYLRNRPSSSGTPYAYFGGAVGIQTDTSWGAMAVNGDFRIVDANNQQKVRIFNNSTAGRVNTYGPNGNLATSLSQSGANANIGYVAAREDGDVRSAMTVGASDNSGQVFTIGANGSFNTGLHRSDSDNNCGYIYAMDSTGADRAAMYVHSQQVGLIYLRGNTGATSFRATFLNGNEDHGYVSVNDAAGEEAGMYVNSSGQGVVWGDVKNFRMDHPKQEGKEIWYASLEGPEAAAYVRGTGTLSQGQAMVEFPEHFELVANVQSMTVVLTPLSGQSKGLAVIEKSEKGFLVTELSAGSGNYQFDWEAKAVRKGYENYRVIRDASEMKPGGEGEAQDGRFEMPLTGQKK